MIRTKTYSLRRRLLLWLLVPLVALGLIALADTYNEAVDTANAVSDRVLAGSALAIAERVVVAENGSLEVDIPYVALEMLTSAAQDRVFYRVDGPEGFITGYQALPVIDGLHPEESGYSDSSFRGEPIRLTSLSRAASTGATSIPFVVTVAETTIARTQLAQTILLRSALRLAILIGTAAAIVWFAVTFSLRPLYRLRDAIAERNPDDLHPIEQSVPKEVRGLVDTVNSFMGRLGSALGAMRHFTGNASHQLRTPLTIMRTQLALASRAHSLEEARRAARIGDEAVAHAERVIAQLLLLAKVDQAASERLKSLGAVNLTELAQTLTADRLAEIWLDRNRAYYGDSMGLPDGYRLGWSYIPHFISTRFYTYAYVFAHLVTLALYARYREEGAPFAERYMAFLAAGGSAAPADLLRPLGVDLVEFLGMGARHPHALLRNDAQAVLLEHGVDGAGQAAAGRVGLDDGEGALDGHGGCPWVLCRFGGPDKRVGRRAQPPPPACLPGISACGAGGSAARGGPRSCVKPRCRPYDSGRGPG